MREREFYKIEDTDQFVKDPAGPLLMVDKQKHQQYLEDRARIMDRKLVKKEIKELREENAQLRADNQEIKELLKRIING